MKSLKSRKTQRREQHKQKPPHDQPMTNRRTTADPNSSRSGTEMTAQPPQLQRRNLQHHRDPPRPRKTTSQTKRGRKRTQPITECGIFHPSGGPRVCSDTHPPNAKKKTLKTTTGTSETQRRHLERWKGKRRHQELWIRREGQCTAA